MQCAFSGGRAKGTLYEHELLPGIDITEFKQNLMVSCLFCSVRMNRNVHSQDRQLEVWKAAGQTGLGSGGPWCAVWARGGCKQVPGGLRVSRAGPGAVPVSLQHRGLEVSQRAPLREATAPPCCSWGAPRVGWPHGQPAASTQDPRHGQSKWLRVAGLWEDAVPWHEGLQELLLSRGAPAFVLPGTERWVL